MTRDVFRSEPFQSSKTMRFSKTVNEFLPLIIFEKRFILDVWQGSEYASGITTFIQLILETQLLITVN